MQQHSLDNEYRPRVLLTGETGGTGASTTTSKLKELLKLDSISGGPIRRGISNRFALFQKEHQDLNIDTQYELFLSIYEKAYQDRGLAGALDLLEEGINQGAKGDVLANFLDYLKLRYEHTKIYDKVWDFVTDEYTVQEALKKAGFVWESKLAILALQIDQMQWLVKQNKKVALPSLKVLLTLDPEIAAKRIGEREQRDVKVEEVLSRKKEDFGRFGDLYTISGQPVTHGHLARVADVVVNTEHLNPNEVAIQILAKYLDKLNSLSGTEKELAGTAIQDLSTALATLLLQL